MIDNGPMTYRFGYLFIACMAMLPACTWWPSSQPEKAKLLVVNVLDKPFFDDCHIKGSINVPFMQVEESISSWDKDTEIVFYCSNYKCTASGFAAQMLGSMGFEHVYVYDAGIADWYQKGLPVEGKCEQAYLKVKQKQPAEREQGVTFIDTQQLHDKMKEYI